MSEFWWRLFGARLQDVPEGADVDWVWTHAPRSWGVFVLLALVAAAVYGVFWLYRREIRTCPRRLRVALAVVRAAVLVVAAVVWLGPAVRVSVPKIIEPYVVLLLDDSLSMSVRDTYADDAAARRVAEALGGTVETVRRRTPSRAELVDRLLLQRDIMAGFARKGRVRVLSVSEDVTLRASLPAAGEEAEAEPWPGEVGDPVPPLKPSGASTNLSRGIRQALDLPAGNPISGIVLVTDGRHNEGDDPAAAAEQAGERGVPIFTVGLGDPARARNLTVVGVWAPRNVFRGDPFQLQTRVRADGFDGDSVRVELLERRADAAPEEAAERVVAQRTLAVKGDRAALDATFEEQRATPGDVVYTVRVRPAGGGAEVTESDNRKSAAVRVLSERARVLLVAGAPTWDFRLARTLLIRDKTIDVSCWLQTNALDMPQDGNTVIKRLPTDVEALFKYDVILLLDPDPAAFDAAWIERLARFLGEHGGGLLWQSGPRHTGRFLDGVRTRDMRGLLPVRVEEAGRLELRLLRVTHTTEWPMELTALGVDHPMLQIEESAVANRAAWGQLPGVYWSYPSGRAKPAAQVLIEHGDPRLQRGGEGQPLLVVGQYGPGRVVYVGFESVWRWRRIDEAYFDRFWVQAVRYLMEGRLLGGRKRGVIAVERDVYPLGRRVPVTARLYGPRFQPLVRPRVEAALRAPEAPPEAVTLRAVPGRPGEYEGAVSASRLGLNELELTLAGAEGEPVRIRRTFTVEAPRIEFEQTRLDRDLLADIAARSGGRYVPVDAVASLPEALPDRRETIIVQGRPAALWDTNRLLLLWVALLGVEWALRKRFWLM